MDWYVGVSFTDDGVPFTEHLLNFRVSKTPLKKMAKKNIVTKFWGKICFWEKYVWVKKNCTQLDFWSIEFKFQTLLYKKRFWVQKKITRRTTGAQG